MFVSSSVKRHLEVFNVNYCKKCFIDIRVHETGDCMEGTGTDRHAPSPNFPGSVIPGFDRSRVRRSRVRSFPGSVFPVPGIPGSVFPGSVIPGVRPVPEPKCKTQ